VSGFWGKTEASHSSPCHKVSASALFPPAAGPASGTVRLLAIAYLGQQVRQASVGALWRVMEDPHADRQQSAMEALSELAENDVQARGMLTQMM
jgi:hypothetical protein